MWVGRQSNNRRQTFEIHLQFSRKRKIWIMHVTYLRLPQPFFAMTCKALKESQRKLLAYITMDFYNSLKSLKRKCLKSNLVVVHWVRKIRTKLGLHLKRIKQECMMFSQQISMSYNLRKTNLHKPLLKLYLVEVVNWSHREGQPMFLQTVV